MAYFLISEHQETGFADVRYSSFAKENRNHTFCNNLSSVVVVVFGGYYFGQAGVQARARACVFSASTFNGIQ